MCTYSPLDGKLFVLKKKSGGLRSRYDTQGQADSGEFVLSPSAFLCLVRCGCKNRPVSPNSKTRFRWIQQSSSQKNVPPFGLDGVYISEPCPSYCSGHGDCISGVCFCDLGYTGKIPGSSFSVSKNSRTWASQPARCSVVSNYLKRKPAKFHSLERVCLLFKSNHTEHRFSSKSCQTL